jgi:hypothetical protein
MLYIPGIEECHAVDLLESVCPRSEYLNYQVWPLPGRGQLMLTFLGLYSSQNKITYLEGMRMNPMRVVPLERLLVSN